MKFDAENLEKVLAGDKSILDETIEFDDGYTKTWGEVTYIDLQVMNAWLLYKAHDERRMAELVLKAGKARFPGEDWSDIEEAVNSEPGKVRLPRAALPRKLKAVN